MTNPNDLAFGTVNTTNIFTDGRSSQTSGSREESTLTKREYFAANSDVPWNAVLETMKLSYGREDFTIQEMMDYRAQLKVYEADALIKAINYSTNDTDKRVVPDQDGGL